MCIALVTTAHPDYALVVIDNRDEYILRPTSRPHWWTTKADPVPVPRAPNTSSTTSPPHGVNGSANPAVDGTAPADVEVLSSRDLQRAERGTWLGITKDGNFAVLTNYRETNTSDVAHPVHGTRSRGGMVTAWLGAHPAESTEHFVHRMLEDGGVKGVGGFSLICGKLRRAKWDKNNIEPLAIISNRCDHAGQVPWICGRQGSVYGLSNATYRRPDEDPSSSDDTNEPIWPKITIGRDKLSAAVSSAPAEPQLLPSLFDILDTEDFPPNRTLDLEQVIPLLKDSIFIPPVGGAEHQQQMEAAQRRGKTGGNPAGGETPAPEDHPNGFETGLYGTQRQTIILVDWSGNVTYIERALWDANGNAIPRGEGDETFRFRIEGFEQPEELRN